MKQLLKIHIWKLQIQKLNIKEFNKLDFTHSFNSEENSEATQQIKKLKLNRTLHVRLPQKSAHATNTYLKDEERGPERFDLPKSQS